MAAERIDSDGDGLADDREINIYHTDPKNKDTDGDGLSDLEELVRGNSPRHPGKVKLGTLDTDKDGAPDSWEIRLNMDLDNPDQNGNGIKDGDDIDNGYDPREKTKVKVEKTIKVSVEKQWLEYYFGDTKLEEFSVSTGKKSTPTPEGEFKIMDKVPVKHYAGNGYDYPNTKWNLHFATTKYRYYIHGAYWHNKFGRVVSGGCVNVRYVSMERLYNFAEVGTKVIIN